MLERFPRLPFNSSCFWQFETEKPLSSWVRRLPLFEPHVGYTQQDSTEHKLEAFLRLGSDIAENSELFAPEQNEKLVNLGSCLYRGSALHFCSSNPVATVP